MYSKRNFSNHPRCKDLFTVIKRKGRSYCRKFLSHGIVQEVNNLHLLDLPSRSTQEKHVGGKVGRPPTIIAVTDFGEEIPIFYLELILLIWQEIIIPMKKQDVLAIQERVNKIKTLQQKESQKQNI